MNNSPFSTTTVLVLVSILACSNVYILYNYLDTISTTKKLNEIFSANKEKLRQNEVTIAQNQNKIKNKISSYLN
jgi:uncharacterized membrane protein